MDFKDLSYVLAISKYQNISRAAESLYISQPTLSKFLMNYEKELNIKLFTREGMHYKPTEAGEIFIKKAKQILLIKDDLVNELNDIQVNDSNHLHIAMPSSRCAYMLPLLIPEFIRLHPDVKLQFFQYNSGQNTKLLLEGSVDLSFASVPENKNNQLEYMTLWTEKLLLVLPKGHPAGKFAVYSDDSGYPMLDPSLLCSERLLLMMPDQRTQEILSNLLEEHHFVYPKSMTIGNMQAIIQLVASGFGFSMLFDSPILHHSDQNEVDLYEPMFLPCKRDYAAVFRKNSYLPVNSRDFINLMKSLHEQGKI